MVMSAGWIGIAGEAEFCGTQEACMREAEWAETSQSEARRVLSDRWEVRVSWQSRLMRACIASRRMVSLM